MEAQREHRIPAKALTGRKVRGAPAPGLSQGTVARALPPESQLPLPLTLPQPHPASTSIICTDLLHNNFISSPAPERWIDQRGDCRLCIGLINLLPLSEASTEGGECGHHSSLPATCTMDRRGGRRKARERGHFPALELLGFLLHLCYKEGYLSHGWQNDLPSPTRRVGIGPGWGEREQETGDWGWGGLSLPPSHHWPSEAVCWAGEGSLSTVTPFTSTQAHTHLTGMHTYTHRIVARPH